MTFCPSIQTKDTWDSFKTEQNDSWVIHWREEKESLMITKQYLSFTCTFLLISILTPETTLCRSRSFMVIVLTKSSWFTMDLSRRLIQETTCTLLWELVGMTLWQEREVSCVIISISQWLPDLDCFPEWREPQSMTFLTHHYWHFSGSFTWIART